MERTISETPEKWVILKISSEVDSEIEENYKIFGTWAGGYLGSDSWKINSGIKRIEEDENSYYFYGYSGSCYKCSKSGYGIITSYGYGILENIIKKSNTIEGVSAILLSEEESINYIKNKEL